MKSRWVLSLILAGCVSKGPVLFRSEESRTASGGPVYNEIAYQREGARDIWMMNQSHHGPSAPPQEWDRVAIVVDTSKTPASAEYWELAPGPLVWNPSDEKIPFKAICYTCHANGPRLVRPDREGPLDWKSRETLFLWNRKMAGYGRVELHEVPGPIAKGGEPTPPVQFHGAPMKAKLDLRACARCHDDAKGMRSSLTRQNADTIRFMVDRGYMPPEYRLGPEDLQKLEGFLKAKN